MSQLALIITIINRGFADDAMAAAKKAGATGGTILTGNGTVKEDTAKFFGISLHAEKEVLLIVASQEKKSDIMKAILDQVNQDEESKGIVFSLPVDQALGFSPVLINELNDKK
ncbi:MAG TPA: P-II family nitrogen regulator [Clostridia bacterium]